MTTATEWFFKKVFGRGTGRAVIVLPDSRDKPTQDHWFSYPEQLEEMVAFTDAHNTRDVWYSPILFDADDRHKEHGKLISLAAADADSCDPANFRVQPSLVVETSPGRSHVYWLFSEPRDAHEVAKLNRRISQAHKDEGCDVSFVNAAKLLRVPGTSNSKYPGAVVILSTFEDGDQEAAIRANYTEEEIPDAVDYLNAEMPDDVTESGLATMRPGLLAGLPNSKELRSLLFGQWPEDKRSEFRAKMLVELYRIGLDDYGVMALAWEAPSNKYRDDNRGLGGLWAEAMKAKAWLESEAGSYDLDDETGRKPELELTKQAPTDFLSAEEKAELYADFIDEWIQWASTRTDAPAEYHKVGAIALLSTVYSEFGYVNPSFGKLKLNIWNMMLGRSTKDRKSTAKTYVERALRRLTNEEYSYVIPDDATPGGLAIVLQERANKSSFLARDEVQGFFEEVLHQSYMAGGISYFTKVYDGWSGGRARASGDKKITPSVPVTLQLFFLGILEDSAEVLTIRNYRQGFLTRFLYTVAERPPGYVTPPLEFVDGDDNEDTDEVFESLIKHLEINRNYWEMFGGGGEMTKLNLSEEAKLRYQQFEKDIEKAVADSRYADVISATSERMGLSILKLAGLLAMDQRSSVIELRHMVQAIGYAGRFFDDSLRVVALISESDWQRDVDKLERYIVEKGGSMSYATAYRQFKDKRPFEFEEMLSALEGRGALVRQQAGKRWVLKITYEQD